MSLDTIRLLADERKWAHAFSREGLALVERVKSELATLRGVTSSSFVSKLESLCAEIASWRGEWTLLPPPVVRAATACLTLELVHSGPGSSARGSSASPPRCIVDDLLVQMLGDACATVFMLDGFGSILSASGSDRLDTSALVDLLDPTMGSVLRQTGLFVVRTEDRLRILIVVARFSRGEALLVALEPTGTKTLVRIREAIEAMQPRMIDVDLPPIDYDDFFS